MKKFRLLLLDANVIIELFRLGKWDSVIERCDIHIARTVVEEANYWEDENGGQNTIDLTPYENDARITIVETPLSDIVAFKNRFDPNYAERLDPGELESLAFLSSVDKEYLICSADHIVFKTLGNINLRERGVSLQEILDKIGLSSKLSREYCTEFREGCTTEGEIDGVQGFGQRCAR